MAITTPTKVVADFVSNDYDLDDEAVAPGLWKRLESRGLDKRILPTITGLILIGAWQLFVTLNWVPVFDASKPSLVAIAGWDLIKDGKFFPALGITAYTFAIGFGLAVVIGVPAGILLGWYRVLGRLFYPYVGALNAAPRIALFPLFLVWFGLGVRSQVFVVFVSAILPIIINTYSGVKSLDSSLLDVGKCMGASTGQIFRGVALPASLPFIMAGVRLGSAYGLLGVIIAEMFLGSTGLGYLLSNFASFYETADVMFLVIAVSVLGLILLAITQRLEHHWDHWRLNS